MAAGTRVTPHNGIVWNPGMLQPAVVPGDGRLGPRESLSISRYIAVTMMSKQGFGGTFRFLAKGDFPDLLLVVLEEKPQHGYEIMKALEERFHGFYKPSAGAVYPALRTLQRRGLVAMTGGERRKTYRITAKGIQHLGKVRKETQARFAQVEKTLGPERSAMFREFRATGRLIGTNLKNVTPEQALRLREMMVEMRGRIAKILAE